VNVKSVKAQRKRVGVQIRQAREKIGMTQLELGEKIGVPHTRISAFENGTSPIDPDVVQLLHSLLGIKLNDLQLASKNIRGYHPPAPKVLQSQLAVQLTVPLGGLQIKLCTEAGRIIGTFIATEEGFTFLRSNAKLSSKKTAISWEQAARLFESGFLQ